MSDLWGLHIAADERYSLPTIWEDYQDWNGPPELGLTDPKKTIQHWGNVQDYLRDRHGIDPYTAKGYKHPASLAMAKLHALAQSKGWMDGLFSAKDIKDDDLLQGAALGLLKIRRNQHTNQIEPDVPDDYHTASTDGIRWGLHVFSNYYGRDAENYENTPAYRARWTHGVDWKTADAFDDDYETWDDEEPVPKTGVWYHSSPHKLEPGTELLPGYEESSYSDFYDEEDGISPHKRKSWVWLEPDKEGAAQWTNAHLNNYLYEVHPEREPHPWNGTGSHGHVTPSAVVKRMVGISPEGDYEQWHDLPSEHTASTDGIRYAHIVEADVAEDLRRLAAVNQDLVDRLHDEFHTWRKQQPKGSIFGGGIIGGLNEWTNIEKFLKDQYPAAHRNLRMGHEQAGLLMDGFHPHGIEGGDPNRYDYDPDASFEPYETGPDAVAQHGYDPKEIAAGMLLLHNKTDRFRGNLSQEDQDRLNDIAQKRFQMQRDYENRTKTAMPAPLPQGIYFRYHPELMWSPGVTAHLPGGKQVGSLEWYDDDHVMVDLGSRKPGEIDRIGVHPDYQGQSIATSMFDFAKQHEPRLHHSDHLTPDGEGWSAYERSRNARLAALDGLTYHWIPDNGRGGRYTDHGYLAPAVEARHNGNYVGHLEVATENDKPEAKGAVNHIWVSPDYRGNRIADSMFDFARQHEPELHHSTNRTPLGDKWVQHEQSRLAAVSDDVVNQLHGEFSDWYDQVGHASDTALNARQRAQENYGLLDKGPISHWPNIENFLKDRYPAAHRGLKAGMEHAGPLLDGEEPWPDTEEPTSREPYPTGPDAVAEHGYDPKGVAAAFMLMHLKAHGTRDRRWPGITDEAQNRLTDIFDKRQKMQRNYENRTAGRNGDLPPMTMEPFGTKWSDGIMARHADDGRPLGHLHWYPDGEIESVRVHPDFQRRGIATAMLRHANADPETYERDGPEIYHSNTLSPAGRAWANSDGHHPADDEVEEAVGDPHQWGWTAVKDYVPAHLPYTGQNEDEMSEHLYPEHPHLKVPYKLGSSGQHRWPTKWGGNHPDVPFDKRWSPNHRQHVPAPWEN